MMKQISASLLALSLVSNVQADFFDLFQSEPEQQKSVASSHETPSKAPESSNAINYARELSKAFTSVADKAIPAVVFIKTEYQANDPYTAFESNSFSYDFFNRFFGKSPAQTNPFNQSVVEKGQGSGFIISADGYILTNYHVVKDTSKILVDLNNKEHSCYEATLVGGDVQTDIALLKIEREKPFPYLEFEDANNIHVGEWAIAVGNPFDLEASVTVGVVSAKGRNNLKISDLEDFLQTDASIYPGNSGGPLCNLDGRIMGMNTAILTNRGNYVGISFAIPSSILKVVAQQLKDGGLLKRGYIGVHLQEVEPNMKEALGLDHAKGAIITQIEDPSPAKEAGLQQGDVIIEVNGQRMKDRNMVRNAIAILPQNSNAEITVSRMGKPHTYQVKVSHHSPTEVKMSQAAQKLGLEVAPLTPDLAAQYGYKNDEMGVIVTNVHSGSIASLARMRKGMLIVNVNHEPVQSVEQFNEAVESAKGNSVFLLANDRGRHTFISLTMSE